MIFRHFVSLQLRCRSPVGGRLGSQGECTPSLGPLIKKGPRERGVHDTPPDDLKTTEEDGASSQIKVSRNYAIFPQNNPFIPQEKAVLSSRQFLLWYLKTLCSDEDSIIYSTATPIAMAQKHVRFCASILQQ